MSFVRGKGGVAKDVRSAQPRDAVVVRGVLRGLDRVAGTAALVVSGGQDLRILFEFVLICVCFLEREFYAHKISLTKRHRNPSSRVCRLCAS